jgi:hypothetical protein
MRTKKPSKASEPTLIEQLGKPLRDFVEDFKAHGADVLQKVREDNPEKYLELSTKLLPLVAALNPGTSDFNDCNSKHDIGIKLLRTVGLAEIDMDESMIEEAIAANDAFIERLQQIRAEAEGQLQ